jgi:CRISPR system Cascade subunit CasA
MFGADFEPSAASVVRKDDGSSPVIVGRVLARGKGITGGYFERVIPCPPKAKTLLASLDGRQTLGSLARERIDLITIVKNKVLKPAILHLLQGGPETLKFDDPRADPFLAAFERQVDSAFFASLFESLDLDASVARRGWVSELLSFARAILDDAIRGAPIPTVRRYRAISQAERTFGGSARKNFPDNFQSATGGTDDGHLGTPS